MVEVATIPEIVEPTNAQWPEPPRLLVEWSSRWEEFKTSLEPALDRSARPLGGEAPVGIFPYRGILAGWAAELILLLALIVIPAELAKFQPPVTMVRPQYDVIYYTGNELPQTQDRGGAQTGHSGRAGGRQAHHRTQAIRVARGEAPVEQVADAPKVNLPHSDSAVANLLAMKSNPGPPPTEGLRSSQATPTLPEMSAIAPSPELNSAASRNAITLPTDAVVPPSPEVSRSDRRRSPDLTASVIPPAPAPSITRDKMRGTNVPAPTVVAPAPRDAQRDLASSRVPLTQTVDAIAPPVSAPPRDTSSTSKMTLPAPAVVAPPPSQVSRELNSWGRTASGDVRIKPVPPPPSASGGSSLGRSSLARANGTGLTQQVVPPPASIGGGSLARSGGSGLSTQVVPPPASIGGAENGNGRSTQSTGSLLGSANVVPPPPGLGGGKAASGSGRGNKGAGAGGPLDFGSSVAPPANAGGNAAGNGVVVSSNPGTKMGLPNAAGAGTIAMSPSGVAKTGLGGSGFGTGIGKGTGPGSGLQREGSGAGHEGAGHGSDPSAHGGISPVPGAGGSGYGANGTPPLSGVSVQGGTTTVTLPSFGAPGGDGPANGPGHSSVNGHKGSGISIEATPSSGGVFAYYGFLKGDRNYSIYIETSLGTAVMQYADPASAAHPYTEKLMDPEPLHKDLPAELRPTRVVIACIIDRSGDVKNPRVLEPGNAETTSQILVALHNWKFRPAFRGTEPVEINAIIGFGVDTSR